MSAPKHTETPWICDKRSAPSRFVIERKGYQRHVATVEGMGAQVEADAALIVRAVNAHDTLVEALRKVVEMSERWGDDYYRLPAATVERARAALALADEGNAQG